MQDEVAFLMERLLDEQDKVQTLSEELDSLRSICSVLNPPATVADDGGLNETGASSLSPQAIVERWNKTRDTIRGAMNRADAEMSALALRFSTTMSSATASPSVDPRLPRPPLCVPFRREVVHRNLQRIRQEVLVFRNAAQLEEFYRCGIRIAYDAPRVLTFAVDKLWRLTSQGRLLDDIVELSKKPSLDSCGSGACAVSPDAVPEYCHTKDWRSQIRKSLVEVLIAYDMGAGPTYATTALSSSDSSSPQEGALLSAVPLGAGANRSMATDAASRFEGLVYRTEGVLLLLQLMATTPCSPSVTVVAGQDAIRPHAAAGHPLQRTPSQSSRPGSRSSSASQQQAPATTSRSGTPTTAHSRTISPRDVPERLSQIQLPKKSDAAHTKSTLPLRTPSTETPSRAHINGLPPAPSTPRSNHVDANIRQSVAPNGAQTAGGGSLRPGSRSTPQPAQQNPPRGGLMSLPPKAQVPHVVASAPPPSSVATTAPGAASPSNDQKVPSLNCVPASVYQRTASSVSVGAESLRTTSTATSALSPRVVARPAAEVGARGLSPISMNQTNLRGTSGLPPQPSRGGEPCMASALPPMRVVATSRSPIAVRSLKDSVAVVASGSVSSASQSKSERGVTTKPNTTVTTTGTDINGESSPRQAPERMSTPLKTRLSDDAAPVAAAVSPPRPYQVNQQGAVLSQPAAAPATLSAIHHPSPPRNSDRITDALVDLSGTPSVLRPQQHAAPPASYDDATVDDVPTDDAEWDALVAHQEDGARSGRRSGTYDYVSASDSDADSPRVNSASPQRLANRAAMGGSDDDDEPCPRATDHTLRPTEFVVQRSVSQASASASLISASVPPPQLERSSVVRRRQPQETHSAAATALVSASPATIAAISNV